MSRTNKYFLPAYLSLLFLFLIRFIPLAVPQSRTWGFNQLTFLPGAVTILYLVVGALALIFPLSRSSDSWGGKLARHFGNLFYESRAKYASRLILALLFLGTFIVLTAPTHFLGDGYTLLNNLASGSGTIHKWSEKATTAVMAAVQSLLGPKNEQTARTAFQIVSIFSGAVSIWFFSLISGLVSENPAKRFLTFLVLLFSGGLLLFFGYVENYPLIWPVFAGFIYFSLKYVARGKGLAAAFIFLIAGALVHLQMLIYVPAFVYLIFCRGKGLDFYRRFKTGLWVVCGFIAAGAIALFVYKYSSDLYFEDIFLPLFVGKPVYPEYAIVSFRHLADLVNLLMLLSPLLIMLLTLSVRRLREIFKKRETTFLALVSLAALAFAVAIDPKLGMPRDWDLFSLSAFGLTLLLAVLIPDSNFSQLKRLLPTTLVCSVIFVGPYLAANLGTESSIASHKYNADLDRSKAYAGMLTLGRYYVEKGEMTQADSVTRVMRFRYPDEWRQRQAFAALEQKDVEKAENIIAAIQPDRFSSNYHALVGTLLSLKGRHEEAITEIDKALQLRPYAANLYLQKAMILRKLSQPEKALESLRQGYRYNKNYSGILEGIATMSMETNQPDSCILYAKRLGSAEPNNTIVFFLLARAYAARGDMEQAGKYAEIYRTRGTGQPSFEANWRVLSEILTGTESTPDER